MRLLVFAALVCGAAAFANGSWTHDEDERNEEPSPPSARIHPKSLYFVKGETFNLTCNVDGYPRPYLFWIFKGNRLNPGAKYHITKKNQLFVRDATVHDAGVYECRAVNVAGIKADFATVQLTVPPSVHISFTPQVVAREDSAGTDAKTVRLAKGSAPTIMPSPDRVYVNIERNATLQCRVIGVPKPEVTWKKARVPVEQLGDRYVVLPDNSLMIQSVLLEDQALYSCIAKNEFGQAERATQLIVTGLVTPVLAHAPAKLQMIEGQDLRINCIVLKGTPKPTLKWSKGGLPLRETRSMTVRVLSLTTAGLPWRPLTVVH
ncbi:CBR-HIM-4 protein [Aphelenchoides avenae]|nr:CBR-HIM-4 protein [Aphelenchus avenae]